MKITFKNEQKTKIFWFIIALIIFIAGNIYYQNNDADKPDLKVNTNSVQPQNNYFQMHVIDVGQGDSIFIKCGDKNILIDGGEIGKGPAVTEYLKSQNVDSLDMVIATHPHSDHIGGLPYVMDNIKTHSFMMSDTPDNLIPTSKIYEKLLNCVLDNNIKYTEPKNGRQFKFDDITMEVLWDGSLGTDLNNTSVVLQFVYKNTSFILAGDAEKQAENSITEMYSNIGCNVLKAGHHGSSTSSSREFIRAVSPDYAVMSVGKDNSYGMPGEQTLNTFRELGVAYYRTDLNGSVVFISDGENIGIKTER